MATTESMSCGSPMRLFAARLSFSIPAALVSVLFFGATSAWCQPVRIESGLIEGERGGAITVYKSIPYAAPPVNGLRWKAPERPLRWSGVRRADSFGPICMQSGVSVPGAAAEPVSEDCLTLSIWTPATSGSRKLPVMVWIPGGGFKQESGSMPLYWGDALAKRGVIVVTLNYRVGVFGFLAHPDLTLESGHKTSGNYGILDQIAALGWIKRNIPAFGGDPQNVTIWGQSAGSMLVNLLMSSPLAHGLFQRAIGQSGGFFTPTAATGNSDRWTLKGAERQGVAFAASAGSKSPAELRRLPSEQILKLTNAGTTVPIIDGYIIPKEPYEVFSAGHQNDVPLLIGSNADEGRAFVANRTVKAATLSEDIVKSFGNEALSELVNAYLRIHPASTDEEARETRAKFERDLRFGWDMWTWARMQAKSGKSKVFFYYFQHSPPIPSGSPFSGWGAAHWQELIYVFDHLNLEQWAWTDADRALANTMATYWTNFAKNGNPNGDGVPVWPDFKPENEKLIQFDSTTAVAGVPNLNGLQLFEDFYSGFRNSNRANEK